MVLFLPSYDPSRIDKRIQGFDLIEIPGHSITIRDVERNELYIFLVVGQLADARGRDSVPGLSEPSSQCEPDAAGAATDEYGFAGCRLGHLLEIVGLRGLRVNLAA